MLRETFPALDHGLCYLDTAATALRPRIVVDKVYHFELSDYANVHRSAYTLGYKASQAFDLARSTCAEFIGAAEDRFVWTSGATASINFVAHGFLKPILKPTDNIVLTIQEHHANWLPWWDVANTCGAEVRVVPIKPDGVITPGLIRQYVDENTRLVAISHISNVTGQIHPIKALCEQLPQHVYTCVDGAQAVGHVEIDFDDLGCDFYVASGHKMYGPSGIGFVAISARSFPICKPYQTGGGMVISVNQGKAIFQQGPIGLEAGTPPISGAVGLAAACEWLTAIGIASIRSHEDALKDYALSQLREACPQIRIFGHKEGEQTGVISFEVPDIHPHDIATILDEDQIAIRAGHHCAMPLMQHWQVPALNRVSLGVYNDKNDIDRLANALIKAHEVMGVSV